MNKKERDFLKRLAGELEVDVVTPDFHLADDNWDSVTILSAVALIDDYFDLTVPGEDLENCETVGQVLYLIRSNLGT